MDKNIIKMERPLVGLSVIVMKEDKVLLGKRKGSHGAGTWAFPGGHIELFEELENCAYREVKEETGLTRENIHLIDKYPVAATNDFFKSENKHYITLFMRAKYVSGEPRRMEPDKCEEWDWFYRNDIPSPLFTPVRNLIEQGYDLFTR